MTQQNTTQVLEKDNLQVRLPNDIYPRFVSTFKSDLVIGPSNINKIRIREGNGGQGVNLTFTQLLQQNLLYSNMVKIESNIAFKFSNVRVRQDHAMILQNAVAGAEGTPLEHSGIYVMENKDDYTTFDANKTTEPKYKKAKVIDNKYKPILDYAERGLSTNPFQAPEFAPCCNFMNAYLCSTSKLSLASNGIPASSPMSTKMYELLARTYSEDEIYNNWNGLLIPTKSVVRKQKFHAFKKTCPTLSFTGHIYTHPDETGTGWTAFANNYPTVLPTYWDVERDPNAATNSRLRGRVDRELDVTYKFEKAIASKNYRIAYDAAAGYINFEETGDATKILRTVVINGYSFPSNVLPYEGKTDEELYGMLGDLLFFYPDEIDLVGKKATSTGAAPADYYVFYKSEPTGQSVTVTKTYTKMSSFVYNPYLSNTSTTSFSSTSQFLLELTKTTNLRELIEYIGAVNIVHSGGGEKDVTMEIDSTNVFVELTQYTVQAMQSSIQDQTILFYNSMNKPHDVHEKLEVDDNFLSTKKRIIKFEHNNLSIGSDLPSRIYIYFDGGTMRKEVPGIRIKNISAKVSNGSDTKALSQRSELELCQLSRSVAFKSSYSFADFAGYTVPYRVTTDVAGLGSGAILAVDISDMGFSSQVLSVGGLSGKNLTIDYEIECEINLAGRKLGEKFDVRSNIVHVTNSSLYLLNSQARAENNLFSQADVMSAIEKFKENANTGKLFMSNRRYFGGSFIGNLLKARFLVPKILSSVNSGVGIANKIIDGAQNVMGAVNSVNDRVNTAKNFFRIN